MTIFSMEKRRVQKTHVGFVWGKCARIQCQGGLNSRFGSERRGHSGGSKWIVYETSTT